MKDERQSLAFRLPKAERLRGERVAILANLSRPLTVTGTFLRCAWPVALHITNFGVRTGRTRQNGFAKSKNEANALPFTADGTVRRARGARPTATGKLPVAPIDENKNLFKMFLAWVGFKLVASRNITPLSAGYGFAPRVHTWRMR